MTTAVLENQREVFLALKSRKDVADMLAIKESTLRYLLYGLSPEEKYRTFEIPKRRGGTRKICAPCSLLKSVQTKLKEILTQVYAPKRVVHGFVNDRGILTNAKPHVKKTWVLNLDLKDFFDTINYGRVRGMFLSPPYSLGEEAATVIAQIVCFDNRVPQGAPTSPIITNMICTSLDNAMVALAKRNKATYTRYADDLTFSATSANFPRALAWLDDEGQPSLGWSLSSAIEQQGFWVNEEKVFLNHRTSRQEVTGLTVNELPNVRRSYLANTRAILHCCRTKGVEQAARIYFGPRSRSLTPKELEKRFQNVLRGRLNFIRQVKEVNGSVSHYFQKYAAEVNTIFGEEIFCLDWDNAKERDAMVKVFISYSWEEKEHQNWVWQFAERLRRDGIYVVIDKDLSLGKRLPHFMEGAIRDNDFVLVICTPTYKERSDARKGGVGYENSIITGELLVTGNEEKFIPVLRKGTWESALPTWMQGKLGVTLSNSSQAEEYKREYKKLLENLRRGSV